MHIFTLFFQIASWYFTLWMGISYILLWNKPPQNLVALTSQLYSSFSLIQFGLSLMSFFMPLWSAGRSVGSCFGLGWPHSHSGGCQLSASMPQLPTWPSSSRLAQAYSHGGVRVPSTTREQAPVCKRFSNLCLFHILLIRQRKSHSQTIFEEWRNRLKLLSGLFASSHCKGIDAGRVRICDQIYSLPQYESYFIYSLPYWWPFRLLPTLYHYKNCCNEHLIFLIVILEQF